LVVYIIVLGLLFIFGTGCLSFSNAQFNPICHLLALLWAHHILHVSRI